MTELFKKLNFKDQSGLLVIDAPANFESELAKMAQVTQIYRDAEQLDHIQFALLFVTRQVEIDQLIQKVGPKLHGDALLWFCYPKGTSKKYQCDFNRDTGWHSLGVFHLEPVRMVAIDEDWSALRFRRQEYIKTLTRNEKMVLSSATKERMNRKG